MFAFLNYMTFSSTGIFLMHFDIVNGSKSFVSISSLYANLANWSTFTYFYIFILSPTNASLFAFSASDQYLRTSLKSIGMLKYPYKNSIHSYICYIYVYTDPVCIFLSGILSLIIYTIYLTSFPRYH